MYHNEREEVLRVIVYSSWRTAVATDDRTIEMVTRSIQRNWKRRITGSLWFGEQRFFEVIEGEHLVVQSLFEKIHEDPHHERIHLLLNRQIAVRRFSDWDSHVVDGPEATAIDQLTRKYVTDGDRFWVFRD